MPHVILSITFWAFCCYWSTTDTLFINGYLARGISWRFDSGFDLKRIVRIYFWSCDIRYCYSTRRFPKRKCGWLHRLSLTRFVDYCWNYLLARSSNKRDEVSVDQSVYGMRHALYLSGMLSRWSECVSGLHNDLWCSADRQDGGLSFRDKCCANSANIDEQ